MRLFMLLVTLLCGLVAGNTEIRHFRPNGDATAQPIDKAGQQQQLSALIPNHTTLTAPYTSTGVEVIHALESADHGSEEKERWYVLRGLDAGHSYELRVSYAASTPSDFYIDLYSVSGFARLHNITLEPVPGTERELVIGMCSASQSRR
ncbi:hypothetical protein GGF46_003288 [Coemansia sp. RSA 552]|nr:hypothetical protein GGF46_003288 [Coemansia sp. RSA 552]